MTTTLEIAWAAGFIEGEGHIGTSRNNRSTALTASQIEREPPDRLARIFGGRVKRRETPYNKLSRQPIHEWSVYGARAAAGMMTIYALMSERRKQRIGEALSQWRGQRRKWLTRSDAARMIAAGVKYGVIAERLGMPLGTIGSIAFAQRNRARG